MMLALLVAAACVMVSVSFQLYDTDAWEHLLVGKAIWQLHSVPRTEVWAWAAYGAPNANPSWGFSALLWPFWVLGGVPGLFVWRWLTTLGAFALLGATARRLGARGLAPLLVLVVCALVYRQRVQIRPETLAGVSFALTLWVLAGWRSARMRPAWLVPIAWVWANAHVSYYLGFVLIGIHLVGTWRDPSLAGSRRRLLLAALACVAVSFVNPFGWRALVRPFQFFFSWSHEPLFRSIEEVGPIVWQQNWSNGLPVLLAGWPLLVIWRARQGRSDRVEWLMVVAFTLLALSGSRFVATYALAAAPYLSRAFAEWIAARAAPLGRLAPWPRAAFAALACVGACGWDWTHNVGPLGIAFDMSRAPVHACDWIAAHDVRGRTINHFALGGYILWRFWPDAGRLPFMDIHPEDATREARDLLHLAMTRPEGWSELTARFRPDVALFSRRTADRRGLLDTVDEDPGWALVFIDDVAALYLNRSGTMAALADRAGYRTLGGSRASIGARLERAAGDSTFRRQLRAELVRQAGESPVNYYGRAMLRAADARP